MDWSSILMWVIWLIYQLVSTVGFAVWYARKHPVEARQMYLGWKRFLIRKAA